MILVCPYCGEYIAQALIDGLAGCTVCNQIFDSSLYNRLLSAAWLLHTNVYHGVEQLISDTRLSEAEAILVYSFIVDNNYAHEQFKKVLKDFGISPERCIDVSA